MIYCEQCGYKNQKSDQFCSECGASLNAPSEEKLRLLRETKRMIQALMHNGELESAAHEINLALQDFPGEKDLLNWLDDILKKIKNKELKANLESAEKALQEYDYIEAANFAEKALLIEENNPRACAIIKESENKNSTINGHLQKGKHLLSVHNPRESLKNFEEILTINPRHPEALSAVEQIKTNLSFVEKLDSAANECLAKGKYTQARTHLTAALNIDSYNNGIKESLQRINAILNKKEMLTFWIVTVTTLLVLAIVGFWYRRYPFVLNGKVVFITNLVYCLVLPAYIIFYGARLRRRWLLASVALLLLWHPLSPVSPLLTQEEAMVGIIFWEFLALLYFIASSLRWIVKQGKRKWIYLPCLIIIFVLIKAFFFDMVNIIQSGKISERCFINKIVYKVRKPRIGERVIFRRQPYGRKYTGTIVGLAGDEGYFEEINGSVPLGFEYVIVERGLKKYEYIAKKNIVGLLTPIVWPFPSLNTDEHVFSYEKILSTDPSKLSEGEFYNRNV